MLAGLRRSVLTDYVLQPRRNTFSVVYGDAPEVIFAEFVDDKVKRTKPGGVDCRLAGSSKGALLNSSRSKNV